ncbi:ribonuclease H-like protein [Corynespora cassiicola Philippines]|uniref:ribonuclease H n=1 Tax=Corynespora cassiicola Philippines TaxID=1448308 RepID=A0A2T2N9L9_CORCC|nr:ribonuclease H-like protein [Corynespora cassiicola Philippines]
MVVYIDGACRSNGTPSAKSSYGIYFGEGSPYNSAGLIESSIPQTSTRAEIEALKHALDIIEDITDKDLRLQHIKIATDSSYLVDAMSTHIYKWIENGGQGSRGKIRHFDRLKEIHRKLDYMEYGDEGGREVEFWLIPREMNREADGLANAALDQMEACSTSH